MLGLAFVLALVFDAVLEGFAVMDGFLVFGTGRLKGKTDGESIRRVYCV